MAREETEKFIAKHTRQAATKPKGRTASIAIPAAPRKTATPRKTAAKS